MRSVTALLAASAAPMAARGETGMLSSDAGSRPMRLSGFDLDSLGPLKALLGTWHGDLGLNVVRIPAYAPDGDNKRTASFATLIHENYMETVTFTPILGAVLNRGYQDANQYDPTGQLDQTLLGVMYNLQIHQVGPDGEPGDLIHAENGQWLLQAEPGIAEEWSVSRFAMIPHGTAVIAVGGMKNYSDGEQVSQAMERILYNDDSPFHSSPSNTGDASPGYADLFGDPYSPVLKLQQDLGDNLSRMEAVELSVTTAGGGGGIAMLRNPRTQVFNEAFHGIFWIETVRDENGTVQYEQLQYAQAVTFSFSAKFSPECEGGENSSHLDCLIKWPHVQVNTLRKLDELEAIPISDRLFPFIR